MTWAFFLLILNIGNIPSIFSNDEVDFLEDLLYSNYYNYWCEKPTSISQQIAICKILFEKFSNRALWNMHINKQAYCDVTMIKPCQRRKITWKTLDIKGKKILPMLLTCHGQHKPVRTSYIIDDYYSSFFLSSGVNSQYIYLFKRTTTILTNYVELFEKVYLKTDLTHIQGKEFSLEEVQEDQFLNTVEARNFDKKAAEMMFMKDIIKIRDTRPSLTYSWEPLDNGHLLTVCLSVFRNILAVHHNALIDRVGILDAKKVSQMKEVSIKHIPEYAGQTFERDLYSCLSKSNIGMEQQDMGRTDIFYLSAGTRENSLFAYRSIESTQLVEIVFYIENFDFENIRSYTE